MLESVFDLFVQARATLDRSDGGMGVGLTLVKQLVELHGGTVSAHSDGAGMGTEFVVRLPCRRSVEATAERTGAPNAQPNEHGGRILIVEDNADSREMLSTLLEIYGYQVEAAPEGTPDSNCCNTHNFDLRWSISACPASTGTKWPAPSAATRNMTGIRLVALTGYGGDADRAAVKEAGFDDHLVKPLQREDLDKVLPRGTEADRSDRCRRVFAEKQTP